MEDVELPPSVLLGVLDRVLRFAGAADADAHERTYAELGLRRSDARSRALSRDRVTSSPPSMEVLDDQEGSRPRDLELELDTIGDEVAKVRACRAADRISAGTATLAGPSHVDPTWEFERLLTIHQQAIPLFLSIRSALDRERMTPSERATSVLHLPPGEKPSDLVAEALEPYRGDARFGDTAGHCHVLWAATVA